MAQQKYTEEQMLQSLRDAAKVTGQPMSKDAYEKVQSERQMPMWLTIVHRFGTWNKACAAAGLTANANHKGRPATWDETTARQAVALFLADPKVAGESFAAYDAWAKPRQDSPSGQTLRNIFGTWKAAKVAARPD